MRSATRNRLSLAAGFAAVLLATESRAAELHVDPLLDGAITAAAGSAWIGSELLKPQIGPRTCRWCEPPGLDESIRQRLKWNDIAAGDRDSNIVAFVGVPVFALGAEFLAGALDGKRSNAGTDSLLILESTFLAADLNQLVKFSVARERPFVHALAPDDKSHTAQPSDNNTSFFSGHSTLVFALASSAGTVASLRGYRAAPYLWAVGMSLATTTAYLRIAGDRHYFTDVATGAIVGTAMGVAIPLLHRTRASAGTTQISGTRVVELTFVW